MSRSQFLSVRSQVGQAVVLIALMLIVIFGAVGLAVDGGIAYYYNASAERAAASAALSGVIFMPAQFLPGSDIPAGSGNDATDRAVAAAARNGFDKNAVPNPNNITVSVNAVPGFDNKLSVTVTRTVQTFFMQVFGISTINISRTAIATYLPPLKLGQPGGQVGSTVSELGWAGYYYMRTEGWNTNRGEGDAYTPHPTGCGVACPGSPPYDVHQISASAGTDLADPTLPWHGGYNFMITVPTGSQARIQVYNAAFSPDSSVGGPNFCENWNTSIGAYPGPHPCANKAQSTNYYMHEDDSCCWGNTNVPTYSAMKYTIFNAPSVFIRSTDTPISQMLVKPIDAACWGGPNALGDSAICPSGGTYPYVSAAYKDMNNATKAIQQKYNALTGAPTNMLAYHSWMDVGSYIPDNTCVGPCGANYEAESSIISYIRGPLAGPLGPGTYRLRIDTLEADGSNPCNANGTVCGGAAQAHKGFAVRVTDAGGVNLCGTCTASALDDMAIFTPINANNTSFPLPVFQLPPDYAGQTVSVDIFDAGDMGGTGSIYIGFQDPTTGALLVEPPGAPPAIVYDLGPQRSNYPAAAAVLGQYSFPNPVEQVVNAGGNPVGDNKWYHFDIPIPSTYNPGNNPNNWWWKLVYRTTTNVTSKDTITITLNLRGNPAHLLQS